MNKSKGFTIIELIVVIAIIAILAAIVLVNVTSYINKANDASIKSDMANMATGMAVCYASTGTYTGCYTATGTDYVPDALRADIKAKANGGADPTVNVTAVTGAEFCISTSLATATSSNPSYVCVDSSGVTKNSATSTCGILIACPN